MKNFKLYFIYTDYFKGYQKMEKLQQKFYKKSNTKPWPLSIKDAIFCLEEIPYAQDSSSIFPKIDSSADLVNKIRDWDLSMLSKSSLYFYLMANRRGREIRKGPNYIQYEWHYITPLILNQRIGKEVVSILPLFYCCPLSIKIRGIREALRIFGPFHRLQISEDSGNDVLIMLEIDPSSREFLITETFKDQNFDKVVEFLNFYKHSINNN